MGLGDLPPIVAEYLARCRAEADKNPSMKAEIGLKKKRLKALPRCGNDRRRRGRRKRVLPVSR